MTPRGADRPPRPAPGRPRRAREHTTYSGDAAPLSIEESIAAVESAILAENVWVQALVDRERDRRRQAEQVISGNERSIAERDREVARLSGIADAREAEVQSLTRQMQEERDAHARLARGRRRRHPPRNRISASRRDWTAAVESWPVLRKLPDTWKLVAAGVLSIVGYVVLAVVGDPLVAFVRTLLARTR